MAILLTRENKAFIARMIELGRFANESAVICEALSKMENAENSYLNPSPFE